MLLHSIKFLEDFLAEDNLRRDGRAAPFHRNLKTILQLCWPRYSLDMRLERTWITSSVLCSARQSGGKIPAEIERICVDTYLRREIDLFPKAFVLALGAKAKRRLDRGGVRVEATAQHPSARPSTKPRKSWEAAAKTFHEWLKDTA
jgi:hypothetical protein